jgi:DNA-binding winged helix-turn-helix (wHTH) protein
MERTIDVHIRALRKKLDDFADSVETVRGIGYRCKPLKGDPNTRRPSLTDTKPAENSV